jgi:hypothetical protein
MSRLPNVEPMSFLASRQYFNTISDIMPIAANPAEWNTGRREPALAEATVR